MNEVNKILAMPKPKYPEYLFSLEKLTKPSIRKTKNLCGYSDCHKHLN